MISNLGGKYGYWKTKTQLSSDKTKNLTDLTPKFIISLYHPPIYPLSDLPREGKSSS